SQSFPTRRSSDLSKLIESAIAPVKYSDTVAYERKSPSARSAISSSKRKIAFWLRSYSSCKRPTRCLSDKPRRESNLNTHSKKPTNNAISRTAGTTVLRPELPDNLLNLSKSTSDWEKIDAAA